MNFYFSELRLESTEILIEDDQVHHFKNVSRGKSGDKVSILNGLGLVGYGVVKSFNKKKLEVKLERVEEKERPQNSLNLILGVPKKEYVESIMRTSVQIGLENLYLIHTKYSPWKFAFTPRLEKILTSSMLQSENPFLPKVHVLDSLEAVKELEGKKVAFATEVTSNEVPDGNIEYIIIGPEGGFADEELDLLRSFESTETVRLPTPIMKAEVAVGYAAGFIQGQCAKR